MDQGVAVARASRQVVGASALIVVAAAAGPAFAEPVTERPYEVRPRVVWTRASVHVELAPIGFTLSDDVKTKRYNLFVRPRFGLEHRRNDWVLTGYLSYEASLTSPATFGVAAGVRHENGICGRIGAVIDVDRHPGALVELCWRVFSIEVQRRSFTGVGATTSVFLGLMLPLFVGRPL